MKVNLNNFEGVEQVPAGACYNYWKCGNVTPGANNTGNELCQECIDWVRSGGNGHDIEVMKETC